MISLVLATKKDVPMEYCNSTLIGAQHYDDV